VFYHHEAGCRDAPFGAPLDGEPLRREFDHVRSIRLPLEAALELGEHKGAVWGPVGAIDLGVKPEWPPHIENPLSELEACALELLRLSERAVQLSRHFVAAFRVADPRAPLAESPSWSPRHGSSCCADNSCSVPSPVCPSPMGVAATEGFWGLEHGSATTIFKVLPVRLVLTFSPSWR
jgi:hypothetical protein